MAAAVDVAGGRFATGSADSVVRVWSLPDMAPLAVLSGHRGRINDACFSPDGSLLASAGGDGEIRVWRVPREPSAGAGGSAADTLEAIGVMTGHAKAVADVCFSADGTRVASAGHDRTARVWDARSFHELGVFSIDIGPALSVALPAMGPGLPSAAVTRSCGFSMWQRWARLSPCTAMPALFSVFSSRLRTHSSSTPEKLSADPRRVVDKVRSIIGLDSIAPA